nr:gas vesicle protein [uncultured Rhodopila sp.]
MKTSIGGGTASSNATLCDLLDRLIDTGVVARGSIVISVAGIQLIYIEVSLLIASVETAFGERRTLTQPDAVAA